MMNELETHSRPRGGRLREQPAAVLRIGVELGKCLIVSPVDRSRQVLSDAAGGAGWDPVVCGDLAGATSAVQRVKFQLAWVDLTSWNSATLDSAALSSTVLDANRPNTAPEIVSRNASRRRGVSGAAPQPGRTLPCDGPSKFAGRLLCEAIAGLRNVLLVICGNADDAAEEIWARQLGAWLYLPDVAWEEVGDLAFLCEQARMVAGNRPIAN